MVTTFVLGILAILCAVAGGIAVTQMAVELRNRGMDANPLLTRVKFFQYIAEYRRVTLEETGQVGPLYQTSAIFAALAAALAIGTALTMLL